MTCTRRARALLLGLLATTAASLGGCSSPHSAPPPPPPPSPTPTVAAFVAAWSHRSWSVMAGLVAHVPADFAALNEAALTALAPTSVTYAAGTVRTTGSHAEAPVTVTYSVPVIGTWTVRTSLALALADGAWHVVWSPATIDPSLGADGHYVLQYTWPPRAAVLAADGTAISPSVPTSVIIGVEGSSVKNVAALDKALLAAGATELSVTTAVTQARADPGAFEAVMTVGWGRYEQVRAALYPVPGVFFQAQGGSATRTPAPLVGVVGTLGAVTPAELRQLGPPYETTSIVGQGGIEQANERQLAGAPGATLSVLGPTGATLRTLATVAPKPGTAVRTTIDLAVEQDAADALASVTNETAIVAIDASTGAIVAAANSSQGSDIALDGEEPPGSTMKMITSTALIGKGLTPESPATCPPVINVDGENIHNAETNEGDVPDLLAAFTVSCNTAFIGLTMANLDFDSLHDAALLYGVGGSWNPGLAVFTGSVPVNDGQTDLAASSIGQGRVVLNPLDLAMVAADLDTGTARLPWITDGAPTEHAPTSTLPAALVSDLHEMMLSVVESGTAAGTGLPSGTYAKTGTAQYGTSTPLLLDAWLAGFNGNIAFAMVDIDAPGDGGPTDGPIVAKFLDALGSTAG